MDAIIVMKIKGFLILKSPKNLFNNYNNSQFIKSFYDSLIYNILKNKFNKKELILLFKLFFVLHVDNNKGNNERKAIMPYRCKWHYKDTFNKI